MSDEISEFASKLELSKAKWKREQMSLIKDRRRRIFEQVALNDISQNERFWANQAERVIKAADEFAEKEGGK